MRIVVSLFTASFLFFGYAHNAIADLTNMKITYDPAGGIYLIANSDGLLQHLVYEDGSIDSIDKNLSPFDFRRSVGISQFPEEGPAVARLGNQIGVLVGGQGFYNLGRNGQHSLRNVYGNRELPCEILDPKDFCLIDGAAEHFGQYFVSYFHRTLGSHLLNWNGSSYTPVTGPLTSLDEEDGIDLTDGSGYKVLLPIGQDGNYILLMSYITPSGPSPLSHLTETGRQPVMMPLPEGIDYGQFSSIRKVGDDVFIVGSGYGSGSTESLAFRIKENNGILEASNISTMLGSGSYGVKWLGIDGSGYAYGIRTSDSKLISANLTDGQIGMVATCSPSTPSQPLVFNSRAITTHNPQSEQRVWTVCGDNLVAVRDGNTVTSIALKSGVARIHLVQTANTVDGIFAFYDGTIERVNDGQRVQVEKIEYITPISLGEVPGSLHWEDGQRHCQSRSRFQNGQSRSYVSCLQNGSWSETTYPITAPIDIYESSEYTWALLKTESSTKLTRKSRLRNSSWESLAELPIPPLGQMPRLVPTATNEVGIFIPTHGFFLYSAANQIVNLPFEITDIVTQYRPVLGDGWLYAFCKIAGSEPQYGDVEVCVFDPTGQRKSLGAFSGTFINVSNTKGFIPLKRGAMFDFIEIIPDSNLAKRKPMVVFQTRIVPLSALFGEFISTTSNPWDLKIWSDPDGNAYLLKSDQLNFGDLNKPIFDRAYRFNGRTLTPLGVSSKTISDFFLSEQSDSQGSSTWSRITQIWSGRDSTWRTNGKNIEPIKIHGSPQELMLSRSVGPNFISSAVRTEDNVILANEIGLWFCAESNAPKIDATTWRIKRHPSCEHHAFIGNPTQMVPVTATSLLAQSGKELVHYDWNLQTSTTLVDNVSSKVFALAGSDVWFTTETELRSLDVNTRTTNKVSDLPSDVLGKNVFLATATYLCSSKGLFHRTGSLPEVWTKILDTCESAVQINQIFYAASSGTLYSCEHASCTIRSVLPRPAIDTVTLGKQSPSSSELIIGKGREIFRLEGDTFVKCDIQWGYGAIPKVNINQIEDGLAITAGGGVVGNVCSQELSAFRLF